MPSINIKVGASVDRNLGVAYRPLIEGAKRAAAQVDAEQKKAARAVEREHKRAAQEEARAYAAAAKEIERWAKEQAKTAAAEKRAEVAAFEKAERAKTAAVAKEAKARAQEEAKAAREAAKEKAKLDATNRRLRQQNDMRLLKEGKERDKEVSSLIHGGARGLVGVTKAAAGGAAAIAGSVARSYGVNLDVGEAFKKNADLETLATNVSNSGYMAGDKRNGRRVASRELMEDALKAGAATGTDANVVLEGLSKFTALTGDLQTGRDVMKDLLVLSKATGSSFDDMAAAAGNVAANLEDGPKKTEQIGAVMRVIAGQGKLGAVEIKDLAAQMAKLASNATSFEGNVADNIAVLGALAQESRAKGGSASATQAATSVASFVGMLKTPARAKEFEKATGSKVYNEKTGLLRDPQTIVKEALASVGTDPMKWKKIFQNMQGARAIEGFASVFRAAGGGKAGLKAVDEEFDRLRKASLSQAEIQESFSRAMRTGQSQAEIFNNQVRLSAMQMQNAMLPALMAMAPAVVSATKELANFTTFLFGDKRGEQMSKDAQTHVGQSIDTLRTQLASKNEKGQRMVSEASVMESQNAEREAREAAGRSAGELSAAKGSRYGSFARGALTAIDYLPFGYLAAKIGGHGGGLGHGLGEAALQTEEQDIKAKQLRAEQDAQALAQIQSANQELNTMIKNGIVVTVKNVEELRAAREGKEQAGRQPSPDEKAKQR